MLRTLWSLSLPAAVALLALGGLSACTGKSSDDSGKKHPTKDDSGSGDTDSAAPSELATYDEFVDAQADTLCALWDACGYLDDHGYADMDACVTDQAAHMATQPCPEYDAEAAHKCLRDEAAAQTDCSTYDGSVPTSCLQACPPPPRDSADTGAPPPTSQPAPQHTHISR